MRVHLDFSVAVKEEPLGEAAHPPETGKMLSE
jgi:hypothetical protein